MDAAWPVVHLETEELQLFHKMDRELFEVMVIKLKRDPMESIQLIALWLWLEEVGFNNLIQKLLSLNNNHQLINPIADEGVKCLYCILSQTPPPPPFPSSRNLELPLTQNLMGTRKQISFLYLYKNRVFALTRINKTIINELFRAFQDIFQEALANAINNKYATTPSFQQGGGSGGNDTTGESPKTTVIVNDEIDDRTMFFTFSRGYRITATQVKNFLVSTYGSCVEGVFMQEVPPRKQPLFARIVFNSPTIVEGILEGKEKVKFTINGKHLWARRYEPSQHQLNHYAPSTS